MSTGATFVLDVGKTLTKASLWSPTGSLVERRSRPNAKVDAGDYLALDVAGIEAWLEGTLRDFSRMGRLAEIMVVGHGAAAALIRDGRLRLPPLDYEHAIPSAIRQEYEADREPFILTGSPALPDGLNLGAQLHFLERNCAELWTGHTYLLPWPQFWSWRLCGHMAAEVTSLGCHTDLWYPLAADYSRRAIERRWAAHVAPLARADAALGSIAAEWVERSGVPSDVTVRCGLHDSNAALIAARSAAGPLAGDMTVLCTGTWFVAMRTMQDARGIDLKTLPPDRDCLVNVDVDGNPVPSARFMGGREIEVLLGADLRHGDVNCDAREALAAAKAVVLQEAMVLPSFVKGAGPYGQCQGRWLSMPHDPVHRWAAVCLYAALMTDAALDLIGSKHTLIVEGRFARAALFVAALARLRSDMAVRVAPDSVDVALGALTLAHPSLSLAQAMTPVTPLPLELLKYRDRWRLECLRSPPSAPAWTGSSPHR
jgi:sugar (pentulose or hexulose) kinase